MAANQLPPIKTLFSHSWERLKGSVFHLLILYIISFALFFVLFIVGLIVAIPLGAVSVLSAIQNNGITPAFFTSLGALGIVLSILIVVAIIMGSMIQAAMIMIVADYKSKPSYVDSLKKGLKLVWPLILAGIITGFIIAGGYFLFVIPGIVFAVSLMFVNMEIILNKQGVISSLKRSMGIVFSNFWGILSRFIIFLIIAIVVSIIPQILAGGSDNAGIAGLFGILSMIINVLVGWFGISYSITLYEQASKSYTGKGKGLMWPLITAVVGWIVGIIFFSAIIGMIAYFANSAMTKKGANQMMYSKELKMMLEDPSLLPTNSPERAELEKQLMQQ